MCLTPTNNLADITDKTYRVIKQYLWEFQKKVHHKTKIKVLVKHRKPKASENSSNGERLFNQLLTVYIILH
jgi:sulfur relay (sulfurtransferase) DsrC/TusE family protein